MVRNQDSVSFVRQIHFAVVPKAFIRALRRRCARVSPVAARHAAIGILLLTALCLFPCRALAATNGIWTNTSSGGLWSTTSNWSADIVANGQDGTADFSTLDITGDDTVHLDSARTIGSLLFGDTTASNFWFLDNNGNAADVLTLSVSSGSPTITVNNQGAIISAVLAGTQGLTKSGAGTLVLFAADTYTGTTFINGGTLQVGNLTAGSLNSTSAITLSGSGTLNISEAVASSQSLGALSFSGGDDTVKSTFNATSATVTFSSLAPRARGATGNFVYTSAPSSTNKIVLTGKTANTFIDPGMFFDGGTASATFAWYDSGGFVRGLTYTEANAQNVTASQATFTAGTLYGDISGVGNITAQTTATMTTLQIANIFNFTIAASNTLTLSGLLKSGNTAGGTIQTGNLRGPSGGDLVVRTDQPTDTLSISSPIVDNSGSGLTKSGAGTLSLSAANTYTGGTIVDGGILAVAYGVNNGQSGLGSSSLTINNGGTVRVDAINALGFNGNEPAVTVNVGGLMTISSGQSAHFNILSLSGGTLSSPSPTGSATNFGTFNLDNNLTAGGSATTSVISAISFALTTPGGTTFTVNPGAANGIDLDVTGSITTFVAVTSTALIKAGAGAMRLSGVNSIASVTLSAGSLLVGNDSALGANTLTLNGGTIQADGGPHTIANAVSFVQDSTVGGANNFTFGGTVTLTGSRMLTVNNGGLTTLGGSITLGSNTLTVAGTGNTVLSGVSSGNGGLAKTGPGTLTLSNSNNFLGGVTVSAGTLILSNSNTFAGGTLINGGTLQVTNTSGSATGGGSVGVNSGGTLASSAVAGQGFITGPVTVANGGTIAGTSGGTLTLSGGLNLNAGSSSTFTLGAPNGTANPLINVTNSGGLVASGTHTINLVGAPTVGTYDLFGYTGAAPTFANFSLNAGGLAAILVNNTFANQIDLQIASVITWTGQTGGNGAMNTTWDTTQTNWASGTTPTAYANGNAVTFQNTNSVSGSSVTTAIDALGVQAANVAIQPAGVTPASVTFNNDRAVTYNLTSAGAIGIGGSTGVTIQGGGIVIFTNANTYTGATTISNGLLVLGDTFTTGSMSTSSAVTLGSASGGAGGFEYAPGPAGASESLGALTFSSGDSVVASLNSGGVVSLAFSSLKPRAVGATANFTVSGGVNGSTNQIVLAGQPAGFINQGTFFSNGSYAWMNSAGGYVRGINYGVDANTVTSAGGTTVAGTSLTNAQITGPITAQIANSAFSTLNISNGGNFTTVAGATLSVNGILKTGTPDSTLTSGFLQPNPGVGELVVAAFGSPNFDVNPLTIASTIQDNGSTPTALTKTGFGGLYLRGSSANTFTGPTTVNSGTLILFKPDSTLAIGGPLIIGIGAPGLIGSSSATVMLGANFQLNNNSLMGTPITIRSDGVFDLAGFSEEFGSLTMSGGAVENSVTGSTFLSLDGDVTTLASHSTATISGDTANVSANIFNVASGTTPSGIDLDVSIKLAGQGITKIGPGTMRLSGNNTFSTGLTLSAGTLLIANSAALGTGPLIVDGGTIGADIAAQTVGNSVYLAATLAVTGNFDLSLTGPIDGPGGIIKNGPTTLTLSGANTFAGPITVNGGTLALAGGSLNGDVTNQATFVYDGGAFKGRLINAGTATFNADFTAGNGFENDTYATVAAGRTITLNGAGLDNEGTLALTSGMLKLGAGTGQINRGNINLPAGVIVNLASGATLTNSGSLVLAGGAINGSGTLATVAGGIISGTGTITCPVKNNGGLLAISGGTLQVVQAFANGGLIQLSGITADLTGGAITNNSSIRGTGNVANAVTNNGGIEAFGGGILAFNGALQNPAAGFITVGAGNELVVTAGLAASAGIINLTGGTFDNNGHALNNTGQISGYGIFRTGGTGLDNNGSVTFSGGLTMVNGNVTNENGRTVTIAYNPAIFTGLVTNNGTGTFKTLSTTATFAGGSSGTFTNAASANMITDGTGVVEIDGAPTLMNNSALTVNGGTLRLKYNSLATIGTGVTATVASGATLELAGSVSQLNQTVNITNNSQAVSGGLLVSSSANQNVGTVTGTGNAIVNTAGSLTAYQIRQNALTIQGTGKVTLLPSGSGTTTSPASPNNINFSSNIAALSLGGTLNAWTGTLDIGNNGLVIQYGSWVRSLRDDRQHDSVGLRERAMDRDGNHQQPGSGGGAARLADAGAEHRPSRLRAQRSRLRFVHRV